MTAVGIDVRNASRLMVDTCEGSYRPRGRSGRVQERYLVEQLGAPGFFHIIARYGYTQTVQQARPGGEGPRSHLYCIVYMSRGARQAYAAVSRPGICSATSISVEGVGLRGCNMAFESEVPWVHKCGTIGAAARQGPVT